MEIVDLKEITGRQKKVYEAAEDAADKKNYKYAIDMYRTVLRKHPGCIEVRRKLRLAQLARIGGEGKMLHQLITNVTSIPQVLKGKGQISKEQYAEALDTAEIIMSADPTAHAGITLLTEAAEAAELMPIAGMTLDHALNHHPKSLKFLEWGARLYSDLGMGRKALEMRQRIVALNPNNREYQDALRQATAEAAMDQGGWDKVWAGEGDYRDLIKDKGAAERLEQEERIFVDDDQVDNLLQEQIDKVERIDNADTRRRLGELYAKAKEWDLALESYEKVVEHAGVLDPSTDEAITKILAKKIDIRSQEWTDYLEAEERSAEEVAEAEREIANCESEKATMLLGRLDDRVRRMPNSAPDRFELGKLLYEADRVDDALQHFQLTQKNAQFKIQASLYMGLCFQHKGLHDLAVDSFNTVVDNQKVMNPLKKDALYNLGKCYQDMDKSEEAMDCFKQIYQVDLSFRDVSEIMESFYKKD
jgi:tetratricopeptide (TPR) repeat protein